MIVSHNSYILIVIEERQKFITRKKILLVHIILAGLEGLEGSMYFCNYCGESFSSGSVLQIHYKICIARRPYECNSFQNIFSQTSITQKHELTHISIKDSKCITCSKKFSETSNLKTNELTHTEFKEHRYFSCQKTFPELQT